MARDLRTPAIEGKAIAVIGVRRGGKTSYLQQKLQSAIAAGAAREQHLLLSLEDERLVGMTAGDLAWLLEEHKRRTTGVPGPRSIYLDEIQVVEGWALLLRRLLDTEETQIYVSGSSAKLLSREVSTSLRGRAMELLVHPFSFRESLRYREQEPTLEWRAMGASERVQRAAQLREYLRVGGFPEAQRAEPVDRIALLKGYVDVMVLRDVIERHNVSNPEALRRMQRALLAAPGGKFSVSKLHDAFRSQGLAVAKDTLHEYLAHLEDAFLVRLVSLHSSSERQRMVNPRKAYPIDPGLIVVYERGGQQNRGHALETVVLLELERRGYATSWVKVGDDLEVDFYAERAGSEPLLIQVSLDTSVEETWAREVRSLELAAAQYPEARALLLTLDPAPPFRPLPPRLEWMDVGEWVLG